MVPWEATQDESLMQEVRAEISKATGGNPPPVYDPFCGGGSIPLEAQRLGLEAHGSDLNPVPVLITKALIEIPPNSLTCRPSIRESEGQTWNLERSPRGWRRTFATTARGCAKAEKRVGHLYPKVKLTKEKGGGEATVISLAMGWDRKVP
jgi:putative DNA methylase